MWTTIWVTAKTMTIIAVVVALSMGRAMTSQNGMAVKKTDRTKPVR